MQNVPTLNLRVPSSARSEQAGFTSSRSSRTSLSLSLRPATNRSSVRAAPRTPPYSQDPSVDEYISIPDGSSVVVHPVDPNASRSSLSSLRESHLRSVLRSSLSFEVHYRFNPDFVFTSPHSLLTTLTTPPPVGVMFQCRVTRKKISSSPMKRYIYTMTTDTGRVLMFSRKCSGTRSSYFTITAGPIASLGDKSHNMYLGKLRANFMGSSYNLFSPGDNPDRTSVKNIDAVIRKELVSIRYENTILKSSKKSPRHMTIAVPSVLVPTDYYSDSEALRKATAHGARIVPHSGIEIFHNKQPRWNSSVNGYTLNFSSRVREPSVKNFQLVTCDDNGDICMQFGKIQDGEYSLDFASPFTPLAAFGIALSSLDFKLCCE